MSALPPRYPISGLRKRYATTKLVKIPIRTNINLAMRAINIEIAHGDKCFNNADTCLNCGFAFQDGRKHRYALFGKYEWIDVGVFKSIEPVAICDQFIFLFIRELKSEASFLRLPGGGLAELIDYEKNWGRQAPSPVEPRKRLLVENKILTYRV